MFLWFSVKKSAVLMTGYFAANLRLFEDIHRLQEQWLLDTKISQPTFEPAGVVENSLKTGSSS